MITLTLILSLAVISLFNPDITFTIIANILLLPFLLIILVSKVLYLLPLPFIGLWPQNYSISQLILQASQFLCQLSVLGTYLASAAEFKSNQAKCVRILIDSKNKMRSAPFFPDSSNDHMLSNYLLPVKYKEQDYARTFDDLINQHVKSIKQCIQNNPQATGLILEGYLLGGIIMLCVLDKIQQDPPPQISHIQLFMDRPFNSSKNPPLIPSFFSWPIGNMILKVTGWSIDPIKKLKHLTQRQSQIKTDITISGMNQEMLRKISALKSTKTTSNHTTIHLPNLPSQYPRQAKEARHSQAARPLSYENSTITNPSTFQSTSRPPSTLNQQPHSQY